MRKTTVALLNSVGIFVSLFLFFAPVYYHGATVCTFDCPPYYNSPIMEWTDRHYGAVYQTPGLSWHPENRTNPWTPNNGYHDVVLWNFGDWDIGL